MEYAEYLKKTWLSVVSDQKLFRAWENGEVTTLTCFQRWKKNNNVPSSAIEYDRDNFILWLNSLGYRRIRPWQAEETPKTC